MTENAPDRAAHADRIEALRLLSAVLEKDQPLGIAADRAPSDLAPQDRARAGVLAATTLRRLGQADAVLRRFAKKVPPPVARNALRLATAEMLALGEAPHAVVDGAVAAVAARPGGVRFKALVNAVARRVAEDGAAIWAREDAARVNAPGWLWGRLSSAWGGAATRRIADAHLAEPPTDLTLRDPVDAESLAAALGAEALPTGGLRLARRGLLSALPGFDDGRWWVQDAAAALPVRLLGDISGQAVLDICAAPGGKTLQLAAAGADVTALDISERRLDRLRQNLARTGLQARIETADALEWDPDSPFDAIVLDAPCSATGTIRRHPDLPRLAAFDLPALTALQDAMLDRAWTWLKPGGRLVFATCSLLPDEGEKRAEAFLARTPGARLAPIDAAALGAPAEAVAASGALRTRPDMWAERGGMDGFFAAMLVKET